MNLKKHSKQHAFTLVELLVVIAIIGILVALLLPAVQAAREAARRMQCTNNLKQMGLSVHNYHDANKEFPAGVRTIGTSFGSAGHYQSGWTIEILPFMEEQPLYDQIDRLNGGAFDISNQPFFQTELEAFVCPSDATIEGFRKPFFAKGGVLATLEYAASSYKGVTGRESTLQNGSPFWWDRARGVGSARWSNEFKKDQVAKLGRGPFQVVNPDEGIKPAKISSITDGTSKTMLIGEYMTLTGDDRRKPAWGASWRNTNLSVMFIDGAMRLSDFDTCGDIVGDANANFLCKRAYGSMHGGGVINFARCDGSVTAIQREIDGVIFEALGTIAADDLTQ